MLKRLGIAGWVGRYAARLRFPNLLALTAGLFLLDLVIPDLVPFVDELLLGLATAMLATWTRPGDGGAGGGPGGRPPTKNVTPPRR